ncbi:hypothetical protein CCU68_25725 [Pseudomonas gingeri NCPPB 3146 = LMG 5327]|uniref:DUF2182 domain-containing protein n=2 Tax=Pseudomonas gingeri TaxID=117681 RepID=A0A7Y7XW24_9PSED|nr:DUF2182 domain-containing protein [Pseudomonas gingeri]NWC13159.1 DUF2182 domain-containing protein [Pseudomonas gingeri]NWE70533.1 DUF2182 domain-containing protein [Pseudomonas gingeri]PNQ89676.1 hypothetical protein CCU68_25725 [Pseudomonas gingeri NCPPB 3146 = LMG 5327]BBP77473.1 hypothetical protein PHLH7_35770 [Pseudomonas sp. Ost2]
MGRYLLLFLTRGSRPWLIVISLAGWGWLVGGVQRLSVPAFCGTWPTLGYAASWQGIEQALLFNPPGQLLGGWSLMLVAMMPLLMVHPLEYLWRTSLSRKRWQALGLFVIGFGSVWVLAGVGLLSLVVSVRVLLGIEPSGVFLLGLSICLLWQASPVKQHSLNRCHHQPRISAFGFGFVTDCLRFGVVSGVWCVSSCWALMLLPMLMEQGHLVLMAFVMVWMLLERFLRNRPPHWRWPFLAEIDALRARALKQR